MHVIHALTETTSEAYSMEICLNVIPLPAVTSLQILHVLRQHSRHTMSKIS